MKKIIFMSFCILLASCNKDVAKETVEILGAEKILMNYLAVSQSADNKLVVASQYVYNTKSRGYQVDADIKEGQIYDHIKLDDVKLEKFEPTTSGKSNLYTVPRNFDRMQLSKLFGKTVTATFETSNGSGGVTPRNGNSGEISSVGEMLVGVSTPSGTPATSGSTISRNMPLTWTPSPNNAEVYIIIEFDPNSFLNEDFSNSTPIERYYAVPDNGSHTVSADKFNGIPNGAKIKVMVARGRVALVGGITNGTTQTAVVNYSYATVVVKPQTGGNGCPGGCLEVN